MTTAEYTQQLDSRVNRLANYSMLFTKYRYKQSGSKFNKPALKLLPVDDNNTPIRQFAHAVTSILTGQ